VKRAEYALVLGWQCGCPGDSKRRGKADLYGGALLVSLNPLLIRYSGLGEESRVLIRIRDGLKELNFGGF